MSLADEVWANGHRLAQTYALNNPAARHSYLVCDAADAFASEWDPAFGPFGIHDPNHTKQLGRWVAMYLAHVAGERCPQCRNEIIEGESRGQHLEAR